jgi:hypothetical protein
MSAVEAQLALSCLRALTTPTGKAAAPPTGRDWTHALSEPESILERWTSSA